MLREVFHSKDNQTSLTHTSQREAQKVERKRQREAAKMTKEERKRQREAEKEAPKNQRVTRSNAENAEASIGASDNADAASADLPKNNVLPQLEQQPEHEV